VEKACGTLAQHERLSGFIEDFSARTNLKHKKKGTATAVPKNIKQIF